MNLDAPCNIPYFLWNENTTVEELRRILHDETEPVRVAYMARIMREARYADVWTFLTLHDVVSHWPALQPRLGRQRAFWEYLLSVWKKHDLI